MDMEMSSSGAAGAVPKLEHPPAREARRCRVLLVAGLVALPLLAFFVLGQESASTVWEMASATFTVVLEPVRDVAWRYYKHFPYAPSPAGLGMAVIIWICTAPEPIHLLYISRQFFPFARAPFHAKFTTLAPRAENSSCTRLPQHPQRPI